MSKSSRARARVREMQAREEAAKRRRRMVAVVASVVVVIVVAVGVWIAVQTNSGSDGDITAPVDGNSQSDKKGSAPSGTVDLWAIPRGESSAPVTVTLFEDFQCPACQAMEAYLGDTFQSMVEDGSIQIRYRPMAFLDNASTTDYSSRAMSTAACVLDTAGRDAFFSMHDLLFKHQPAEGTAGLTDDKLADLAKEAGADRDQVRECQQNETFRPWVAAATDQASKENITGTPTILIDGKKLEFKNNEDPVKTFKDAVQAAS